MGRWPARGLLLHTLLCWTLLELGCAGTRPHHRWQQPRFPRQPYRWNDRTQNPAGYDRGSQRIEYPSLNDDQMVRYPSLYDRGQKVVYPSLNDNGGSGQSQVKTLDGSVVARVWKLDSTLSGREKGMIELLMILLTGQVPLAASPHTLCKSWETSL